MKRIPFILIFVMFLSACNTGIFATGKSANAETAATSTSVPATATALVPLCSPCEQPAVATAEPTTQPTATCEPTCSGWTMVQETKFGQPNPILNDMDVGDASLTAVIEAWDPSTPDTVFIAIVDQMNSLDFEREKISGTYWYFTGDPEAVYCRASQMASEMGGKAYKLYVGSHQAPAGWSKVFPSSWKMKTWVFVEPKIEVPGAAWDKQSVQVGDISHTYGSDDWTYGQLWDGEDASEVYHFIVWPGWSITTPKYQGTVWSVSGVTFETVDLLIMRFEQMTSDEVEQRDDHPTINTYYCGPQDFQPSGWNVMPNGWSCSNN